MTIMSMKLFALLTEEQQFKHISQVKTCVFTCMLLFTFVLRVIQLTMQYNYTEFSVSMLFSSEAGLVVRVV